MSLTIQRKQGETPTTSMASWDPFRVFDMFRTRDLPSMFDMRSPWSMLEQRMDNFYPQFDVKEDKEGYVFKADVPGVNEADLEITLQNHNLKIAGKRESDKEEKTDTYYSRERTYGTFMRTFTLPENVNAAKVHAELRNGVLQVYVPRTTEAPPKKIEIKAEKK